MDPSRIDRQLLNNSELFNHWYVVPMACLKAIPNNDGSFIALATALFLYERYIIAKLQKKEVRNVSREEKKKQIASDFNINIDAAGTFWNVMRHGLLHQGMPKQLDFGKKLPDWEFSHSEDSMPIELKGRILVVQPWSVVDKVISLWQQEIELITKNVDFPWAQVFNLNDKDTSGKDYSSVTGSSNGSELK
jgi:hypothetical protein